MADTTNNFGDTVSKTAADTKDSVISAAKDIGDQASSQAGDLKAKAGSITNDLKQHASDHAGDAKDLVSNMANEARSKIAEIVDQQKSAGAAKLTSLSRAAQNAAGDLDNDNPNVARFVRDAASTVDRFANDLQHSNISDVVASISTYARRQPVAFFAGSILAGFVLARFIKSEPSSTSEPYYPSPRT